MAKYKVIANQFSMSMMKGYIGPVVACAEGFFLFPAMSQWAAGMAVAGGLAVLAVDQMTKRAPGQTPWAGPDGRPCVFECDASLLSRSILDDPEWPKGCKKGAVIVIPRPVVQSLKYPWWGGLKIQTPNQAYSVEPIFFFRGGVLRTLREMGWQV